MNNSSHSIDTEVQDPAGSVSLFILIMRAAIATNTYNVVSQLLFSTEQCDIRTRSEIEKPKNEFQILDPTGLA